MKNDERVYRTISESLSITQGFKFRLGGQEASDHNRLIISDCIDHWVLLPLEAVGVEVSEIGMSKRLVNFTSELVRHDFTDVLNTLEVAYRTLIKDECCRLSEFKAHTSRFGVRPTIFSPITWAIERWFESRDHSYLAQVIQFLRFPAKLHFEMKTLEDAALASYLEAEHRLSSLDLTENPYVKPVNQILRDWLSDFDARVLPVRHGPGSVAEGGLSKAEKYLGLRADARITYVTSKMCGSDSNVNLYYPFGFDTNLVSSRTAKVVFVPKNASKLRTICMEPVTLQYFQQGVMRCLASHFRQKADIRKHVTLEDQTPNQECARLGSLPVGHPQNRGLSTDFATIDLSAASDSVTWVLARTLFSGTSLLKWLIATRSTHALLPNGETIRTVKYAPMGSALCFPIECLIFAACTEYVVRQYYGSNREVDKLSYRVYGDDIAVSGVVYNELAKVLSSFGFIVNQDKSYTSGPFRESCGKEYFEGYDVTPLYYRTAPVMQDIPCTDFMALCMGANNAFLHGLTYLRAKYINTLLTKEAHSPKKMVRKLKPMFTDTWDRPPYIWSPYPSNFHLRKRWNKDLQVLEYEHLTVHSTGDTECPEIVEHIVNYFEFLVEADWNPTRVSDPDDLIVSRSVVPRMPAFRRSWTALWQTRLP